MDRLNRLPDSPNILPLPEPTGWGRGWGTYNMTCGCGAQWVAVAPVGGNNVQCPYCGFHDPDQHWHGLPGEPANDGCWITGSIRGDFALD